MVGAPEPRGVETVLGRIAHMNPALCPRCGEMVRVFEAAYGMYLGCEECLWMSEPERLETRNPPAQEEPGDF